ncbi:putative nuclease HARBI1 [Photinus pyralis]|uniref:putative nuclease HARBI1 n=1 Tax=Photinus pyralis TaxID=7054 RepID=UPI001266FF40|nr:putative nuclease HARBI1 [Photinus pyralis]XP_031354357.1 putative nuclease HARBI1 [Photinus pyralis]
MDEETYLKLLRLVTPLIKKSDTHLRPSISPHERLTSTLRFLATGRSYEDLKFSAVISPQALGQIIPETCDAIYSVLKNEYLKFPKTENDWKAIAREFEDKWNFPNCLGAVDGKHVQIVPPHNSGSYFYNYKCSHSLVLLAVVNANYKFIYCHFGTNGRVSDGGVIEYTTFYDKLKDGTLRIPLASEPKNSGRLLPYVFIGDEAFALREDFLKPFSQKQLNSEKRIFNYRLSRCRRIVENAFGILAARFRLFHTAINMKLENIDKVVLACCALHNFLRESSSDYYSPPTSFDSEDIERGEIQLGLRPEPNTLVNLQSSHN